MAFENYTIRQLMKAWFNSDFSEMSEETFKEVKIEYIDTAGLYLSEEFDKVAYIQNLNGRRNTLTLAIDLQRKFCKEFDAPYLPNLEVFQKYGYILNWNKDLEDFANQLKRVEISEYKYTSQLEIQIKELRDIRKKNKTEGETPIKQTRESFIRTVNSLGKIGYKIDNDKTTVEELALMIKQQKEENEYLKSQQT